MADGDKLASLAQALVAALNVRGLTVATAESCTGGWVAKSITDVPGSSGCFGYGIVSYSNAAKERLLSVSSETLTSAGAVSEQSVVEMARGARALSGADLAVAVSGVAGPGGGSPTKPVGSVWFAWSGGTGTMDRRSMVRESIDRQSTDPTDSCLKAFDGDRDAVRRQAVVVALEGLLERLRRG